mmetsp:Transcript_7237/g.19393  ORF Transcript_7237/g.19393 Transcript_7237/m.19393 type:complete len:341 (+) Transcript_7237:84-1106(+)|eukprot:CAMPEP_0202357918 /NCGR_PEP_ID=MMETSP1126-20121109/11762_1 /ASSEMBLY_ACC=CAM_ASM_000457 /TAXON_ID=3047 /ORGANISM="Dunaliella tertiolecta, Strain CCMP1320" /LENGTH=340 /DNA_ID=CAMNT_0048950913 /DNA_START=89 /DNA_END=1111 /DNA_ORIENTATION=+
MGDPPLEHHLAGLEAGLATTILCLFSAVKEISTILREQTTGVDSVAGSANPFGDQQLKVDMAVDELLFARLQSCPSVEAASSEEQPTIKDMPGKGYTVVFDPLDGSSIVGANLAVGSIFGIYPGKGAGKTGREQAAALYAVYGPRTIIVMARPSVASSGSQASAGPECPAPQGGQQQQQHHIVQQFALTAGGQWKPLQPAPTAMDAPPKPLLNPGKKVFAPANIRCAADNAEYSKLVDAFIKSAYTLRYTGGMVPDVHHLIAKGGGIFVNPSSSSAPAKLRLLYECAPLALIIEAAGGASSNGKESILDAPITSTSARSTICLGATDLVEQAMPAMQASL